ncbi:MAG: Maf family protein [Fimbriimonadales bacterium]
MTPKWPVVLASGSPRRKDLLSKLFAHFVIVVPNVNEDDDEQDPERHALKIATRKAEAVAKTHPERLIIAADTIVVLNRKILGKPNDENHAIEMLQSLCGETHTVITAVSISSPIGKHAFAEKSQVTFKSADHAEIESYVKTGEPMDKAGAYGIQGMGGTLVTKVEGDYDNVVGLPITRLTDELRKLKLTTEE